MTVQDAPGAHESHEDVVNVDRRVTVVIPMLNESAALEGCLRSIASQSVPPDQILLVDGGSDDGTIELSEALAQTLDLPVRILRNVHRRVPHGLNLALAEAETPYFLKISAHATMSVDFVAVLVGHLAGGYWGAGGRKQAVGIGRQGRANAAALNSRAGVGGSKYHYASSAAEVSHIPSGGYLTHRAREIGGWDETLPVNQDVDFDIRLREAGGRLLLDPAAVSFWRCRESLMGLFTQYRRYGRGKVAVAKRHVRETKPRQVAPIFIVAALAIAPIGLFGRLRLLAAPALFYGAAVSVAGCVVGRRAGVSGARAGLAIAAMHVGFGVGEIEGCVGRGPMSSQVGAADSSGDVSAPVVGAA